MTPENDEELKSRLYNALENMRRLADGANETDILTIEGLAYHIQRRMKIVSSMRDKPGIYLTKEEVNEALDTKIELLPDEDNPTRNMI